MLFFIAPLSIFYFKSIGQELELELIEAIKTNESILNRETKNELIHSTLPF